MHDKCGLTFLSDKRPSSIQKPYSMPIDSYQAGHFVISFSNVIMHQLKSENI